MTALGTIALPEGLTTISVMVVGRWGYWGWCGWGSICVDAKVICAKLREKARCKHESIHFFNSARRLRFYLLWADWRISCLKDTFAYQGEIKIENGGVTIHIASLCNCNESGKACATHLWCKVEVQCRTFHFALSLRTRYSSPPDAHLYDCLRDRKACIIDVSEFPVWS